LPYFSKAFSKKLIKHNVSEHRLIAIDLARGIAMLGVALVNIHAFATTWGSVYGLDLAKSAFDVAAEYVIAVLFTHRSYPVLAFLFGAGLAMQWQHLPAARRTPRALRPRLWALLGIGVAHGLLLWPGEILTAYAVIGLVLVAALKASDARLAGITMALYALVVAYYGWIGSSLISTQELFDSWRNMPASFASTSVAEAFARRRTEYLERGLTQLAVLDIWLHVLFGMVAAKSGALQRFLAAPLLHKPIVWTSVALLVCGSAIELVASRYGGWSAASIHDVGEGLMAFGIIPASVGAIGCWLTIAAVWSPHRGRLASFVMAAGRAPLTQFIGHFPDCRGNVRPALRIYARLARQRPHARPHGARLAAVDNLAFAATSNYIPD
jgi:uncharacterized protein